MSAPGKTILETKRLILREMTPEDLPALCLMLKDEEVMYAYAHAFSDAEAREWLERQLARYRQYGFGLWAVELKDTGEFIGDCGITMQNIHGQMLPEVGYHIRRDQQRKGYASEAAAACIRAGFEQFGFPAVYSYMKYTNSASACVAQKNGMHFVEEYADPVNTFTRVYAIDREEWEKRQRADVPGDIWETLYEKAREQYHPQMVSPFLTAHHVVCALESENGEIFTGFCIESCSGVMNLCAERVAALNMYGSSGQTVVRRMIAFRDRPPYGGGSGIPCGACREFFMQLSEKNREMEILVDWEKRQTVTLQELLPRWWGDERYQQPGGDK